MKKFHIASILLGVVLLIFLIWSIGIGALWRDLSLLGWGVIPFVLMDGIVSIFHTLGWRACLSPSLQSLPFHRLVGIHLAGSSINFFTPTATLGGEVIKGTLLSFNGGGHEAATGVIIGKLADALSQILFVALGSIFILWKTQLPLAGTVAMLTGSVVLGAGIGAFLLVQKHGKLGTVVRWLVAHRVGGKPLKKAAHQITRVDEALQLFYKERPRNLPLAMSWHAVAMVCSILKTWYFLFLVAEESIFAAAGIFFLTTWFDLLLFAVPLEIGVQEGTRVLAFKGLQFTSALGLTYGIVLRIQQIFWAGIGLLIYAFLLTGKREKGMLPGRGATNSDPSIH